MRLHRTARSGGAEQPQGLRTAGKSERAGKVFIDTTYYEFATGALEKARTIEELWSKTYPREVEPYDSLGWNSLWLGDSEAALGWGRKALPLDASDPLIYELLGVAYVNLNRLSEAEAIYREDEKLKLADPYLTRSLYELAFLQADKQKIARLESAAITNQGVGDRMLASQAGTAAWYGKLTAARELTQHQQCRSAQRRQ